MKFLKWGGIALVALVAIFAVLVFVTPASRIEVSVDVDKPVSLAWQVFTDESRMGEWLIGFKSMEIVSGEPMTVGSRYRLVFEEEGELIEMEEHVLTLIPEKEFSFDMTSDIVDSHVKITLEAIGERTKIVAVNEVRGSGLFAPFTPLFEPMVKERQLETYAKLKALIEAEG